MKKLVFVINDLSGVGKTTLSNLIHHWQTRNGYSCALLATNCSDEAQDLFSYSRNITTWDFNDDLDLSCLLAEIDGHDSVVIDVGSGDAEKLGKFCEKLDLWEVLGEIDVELTSVLPVSISGHDAPGIVDIAECFSDNSDYLVVTRHKDEFPDGEDEWKGSYPQKALSHLGAIELDSPSVKDTLHKALRAEGYALHEALSEEDEVNGSLRAPLQAWEKAFWKKFESEASEFLAPKLEDSGLPADDDPAISAIAS